MGRAEKTSHSFANESDPVSYCKTRPRWLSGRCLRLQTSACRESKDDGHRTTHHGRYLGSFVIVGDGGFPRVAVPGGLLSNTKTRWRSSRDRSRQTIAYFVLRAKYPGILDTDDFFVAVLCCEVIHFGGARARVQVIAVELRRSSLTFDCMPCRR